MVDFLEQYGYQALFLSLLLENTVVVGVFFPGIAVTIAAGYFAGTGDLQLWLVFVLAWLAVFLGDGVGYCIGRYGLHRWGLVKRLVERNAAYASRLAAGRTLALVLFQFPMPTRTAVPIVAGTVRMPPHRWLVIDATATTLFVSSSLAIGYVTGKIAGTLEAAQTWGSRAQVLFILLFVVWCISFALKIRRNRRARQGAKPAKAESDDGVHADSAKDAK